MHKRLIPKLTFSIMVSLALTLGLMLASPTSALGQQNRARRQKIASAPKNVRRYACPMHPEVRSKSRSRCPKCGMFLTEVSVGEGATPSGDGSAGATTSKVNTPSDLPLRIPNTTVYDQNGKRLNFYTDLVRGKTVLINFIFTTCQGVCPPMTARLRKVQQELGERLGRDVGIISISVDPTIDVPERLKSFAEKFKVGPGWTFVTGSKPEVDQLLKALGASTLDKNDHTPMILVGNDSASFWTRVHGLSPSSTLLKTIEEAAARSQQSPFPPSSAASGDAGGAKAAQVPLPGAPGNNAVSERRIERSVSGGAPNAAPNMTPSFSNPEKRTGESPQAHTAADASKSYFPNLVLMTQDNKPVRFYDDLLKGKIVLINFMFTTCQGVCSPMTANLAKVQKYLGEHVGREVVMISISVDPIADTPAVLKKYAENFKAGPGWYFLTGKKENLDWVLHKLGNYVENKLEHSSILIIGNEATGEWAKTFAMTKPTEIAGAVRKLLGSGK